MEEPRRPPAAYLSGSLPPTAGDVGGDSWHADSPIGSGWTADMRYPEVRRSEPLRNV